MLPHALSVGGRAYGPSQARGDANKGDALSIDRYTLGEVREAATALADDALLFRVIGGSELAGYKVCRFLSSESEDCVKCPERTQCHSSLPS